MEILLKNKKVFDEKSIAALKKWFIEPNHSCTCFDIGKKYDLHSMSANGVINGLGGRVQKSLADSRLKDRKYSFRHKIHYSHEE
jgi:5-methylcytosine-specific restriction protein A